MKAAIAMFDDRGAEAERAADTQVSAVAAGTAEANPSAPLAMAAPVSPTMPAPKATAPAGVSLQRLTKRLRAQLVPVLLGLASIVLLIGAWYLLTRYRVEFYVRFTNIPTPGDVASEFVKLIRDDKFLTNIVISLRRILIGFAIATVFGIALGLMIGRYALLKGLLLPALEVLRPIPAIAWVPMSIMLWPTTETSIVFITFIGSFFPILLNTMHGVSSVDHVLVRAARCLGASEFALMTQTVLPGALPSIFTGLAVGMGVAWVSLIAAEMISGQFGIGYFTWEAYALIEYSHIVIGMLVIGVLGLFCSGAILLSARLLMPWQSFGRKEK